MLATSLGFPEIDAAIKAQDVHALLRDGSLIVGTLFGRAFLGEWIKEDILPELHKGVKQLMTVTDIQALLSLVNHKGWKTSEFLAISLSLIIYVLSLFLDSLQQIHITPETTLPVVVSAVLYGFQRAIVKRGAAGAIAAVAAGVTTAATLPVTTSTPVQTQSSTLPSDTQSSAPIPPFAPDVVQ